MINRDVLQVRGAKETINLLRVLTSVSRKQMQRYANNMEFDLARVESALTEYRYGYIDSQEDLFNVCKGVRFDFISATCFCAALKIADKKKLWLERSSMLGFEYSMSIEGDPACYQLLYFSNDGARKLNQYNHSKYPYENIVPVIVFHNKPVDELYSEPGLEPKGRYIVISITQHSTKEGKVAFYKEVNNE